MTMEKLTKRLPSGILVLLAVILPAYYMPSLGIYILIITISTLALLEFYHLLERIGGKSFRILGMLFGMALITGTWIELALKTKLPVEAEPMIIAVMVPTLFLRLLPQKTNGAPLATAAYTIFGVLYVSVLFNFFTKLVFRWDPAGILGFVGPTGRLLFFYILATVKVSDIGAYFIGSKWGRRKLIPRISPGKTWTGSIGGILCGLAGSLVFRLVCGKHLGELTMSWLDAFFLGLLLPLVGIAGDLGESMLKRSGGIKDSSGIIPGMGGVLDVLDSLLFAAPVLYIYATYVLAP
jgi:phosphatidate cytidylyltransferase